MGPEVHYENTHPTRSSLPDHGKSYLITSHSELGPHHLINRALGETIFTETTPVLRPLYYGALIHLE